MSKFDPKSPKGSVPNGQSLFANRYAIRWLSVNLNHLKTIDCHSLHLWAACNFYNLDYDVTEDWDM